MLGNIGNAPCGFLPLWNHGDMIGGGILLGSWLPYSSFRSLLKLFGFQQVASSKTLSWWLSSDIFLILDCMYYCVLTLRCMISLGAWSFTGIERWGVKIRFLTCQCLDFSYFLYGVCFFPLLLFYFFFCFSFGSPCRTPVSLPLLVGCPSLCLRSPGSRRVLLTKQENNKNCRTLRGSSDR